MRVAEDVRVEKGRDERDAEMIVQHKSAANTFANHNLQT